MKQKITEAKQIIADAIEEFGDKIAVGCSWGKDSMVVLHLALQVKPDIPVFSILTKYKPRETFDYAVEMSRRYKFKPRVYMVSDSIPLVLKDNGFDVITLSDHEYQLRTDDERMESGLELHRGNPKLCCQLLKLIPARYAYDDMGLKAWFSGLRNTEGHTRIFMKIREERSDKEVKINPILTWVENEVWRYMLDNDIPIHPWYIKDYPGGKKIRSLGCEPCTVPIFEYESERDGRWRGTTKAAGECGIHTQPLRKIQIDEA